jgi:hypothetical protein
MHYGIKQEVFETAATRLLSPNILACGGGGRKQVGEKRNIKSPHQI